MTAGGGGQLPGDYDERSRALAVIADEYPGWTAWPGVAGLVYARYPRSSPPLCVRSTSLGGLRTEIEKAKRERGTQ